jgi:hypothetical protein
MKLKMVSDKFYMKDIAEEKVTDALTNFIGDAFKAKMMKPKAE